MSWLDFGCRFCQHALRPEPEDDVRTPGRVLALVAILSVASVASADDPDGWGLSGRWEQTYPGYGDQAVMVLTAGPRSVRGTATARGTITIEGKTGECSFTDDGQGNWIGSYRLPGRDGVGVLIGRPGKDEIIFQAHFGEISHNRNMRRVSRDPSRRRPERPPQEEPPPPPRPRRAKGPWEPGTVAEVTLQVVTRDEVTATAPGAPPRSTRTETALEVVYQDTVVQVDDADGRPVRIHRTISRARMTSGGRTTRADLEGRDVQLTAVQPGRWSATVDGREVPIVHGLELGLVPEEPTVWRAAEGPRREEIGRLDRGKAPPEWPLVIQVVLREFRYHVSEGSWATDVSGAPGRCGAEVKLVATQRMGGEVTERTRHVSVAQTLAVLVEGSMPDPPAPSAGPATSTTEPGRGQASSDAPGGSGAPAGPRPGDPPGAPPHVPPGR